MESEREANAEYKIWGVSYPGLDLLFTKMDKVRAERVWRDSIRNLGFDSFHLSYLLGISFQWHGGHWIYWRYTFGLEIHIWESSADSLILTKGVKHLEKT